MDSDLVKRQVRQIVQSHVELRRFLAVIQALGTPRYQRADEDQLRKALDDRPRACS